MKKILYMLYILLLLDGAYAQAPNSWQQMNSSGISLKGGDGVTSFTIGNKAYIVTAYYDEPSGEYKNELWEYDPVTDSWTRKANFSGEGRYYPVGFSISGKGYIGTGAPNGSDYKNDFWEYDPTTDAWTRKADFPGTGRYHATGFSIGDKGYIGTGFDGSATRYKNDFWEYNPAADTWTKKADFASNGRYGSVSFSIADKGYIGTGYDETVLYKDFWEYDPITDTWTKKADFGGTARLWAVGLSINSKGYIGTGLGETDKNDFWEYDPVTDTWIQRADFGGAVRFGAVGCSIGNHGYIGFGGTFNGRENDWWQYTPGETGCPPPSTLNVTNITASAARLQWTKPGSFVYGFQVAYRSTNAATWIKKFRPFNYDHVFAGALSPNTTYTWKIRSLCRKDQSEWITGPNFTTASSFALLSPRTSDDEINSTHQTSIRIIPNPSNGNFNVQMQLPESPALTTLTLYSKTGTKLWQQDAGVLGGTVNRYISLQTKLPVGVFVLMIQHGNIRLMQKLVVTK